MRMCPNIKLAWPNTLGKATQIKGKPDGIPNQYQQHTRNNAADFVLRCDKGIVAYGKNTKGHHAHQEGYPDYSIFGLGVFGVVGEEDGKCGECQNGCYMGYKER